MHSGTALRRGRVGDQGSRDMHVEWGRDAIKGQKRGEEMHYGYWLQLIK